MDYQAQLTTAMQSLITAYVAACAAPKPSYSVDGQSISYGDYLRMLTEAIKSTNELLLAFDPYILQTQAL